MANKTTNNPKSQDQAIKAAVQSQIARIKKEEEEELWISGEELYTEGSSDEEEYKTQSRSRRKFNGNRSSRASSGNPSVERSGHSIISTDSRGRDHPSQDNVNERKSASSDTPKSNKTFSSDKSSMESQRTFFSSATQSSACSASKNVNSSDFTNEEDRPENTEISWKANRETVNIDEAAKALRWSQSKETFESDVQERETHGETDAPSTDTTDERVEKKMLQDKNLDQVICEISDRLKKARQETLAYQCENRRRLENILSCSPTETGKLAENTRQFFQLCPKYMMLSAENTKNNGTVANIKFHNNESNISFDTEEQAFKHENNVNSLNRNDELLDLQLFGVTETEKQRITNLINNPEDVSDKTIDSVNNPYSIDKKTEEMLLEVEKKISVYSKNSCNDQGKHMLEYDSVSIPNTITSTYDSVSTIKSLRDVDKDLLDEVIKEARIIDPSSILKVAEDRIGT